MAPNASQSSTAHRASRSASAFQDNSSVQEAERGRPTSSNKRPAHWDSQLETSSLAKRAKASEKHGTEDKGTENGSSLAYALDMSQVGPGSIGSRAPSFAQRRPVPLHQAQEFCPSSAIGSEADDNKVAWAFLCFLKSFNATSIEDMLRLRKAVQGAVSFDLPICTDLSATGHKMHYFLKVGGRMGIMVCASPKNRAEQSRQAQDPVAGLGVLQFVPDQRRASTLGREGITSQMGLPNYLVPIGEVYVADRSLIKWQEVSSTNFFVLMDIATPRKALWMVYRYQRLFEESKGRASWAAEVPVHGRNRTFTSLKRPFDTIRLLASVHDWTDPTENMVSMDQLAAALPGTGNIFFQPVFYTPALKELQDAVKKGWTAEISNE